ncbi:unnamed protein product [Pleuronectes platessa]|uniref:Uncharacterized protein n=1 Tax=Pleuronectes platessa TaxID=8262 RepID=A0A9N7VFH9_PLEPL|nr:unnamed protein product [Pleuronectes platessa]
MTTTRRWMALHSRVCAELHGRKAAGLQLSPRPAPNTPNRPASAQQGGGCRSAAVAEAAVLARWHFEPPWKEQPPGGFPSRLLGDVDTDARRLKKVVFRSIS